VRLGAAPVHLDLRNIERVELECRSCHVGGSFKGTAAFLISCACGGQVKITPAMRVTWHGRRIRIEKRTRKPAKRRSRRH